MSTFPPDAVLDKGFSANDFKNSSRTMGVAMPGTALPGLSPIYKSGMYPGMWRRLAGRLCVWDCTDRHQMSPSERTSTRHGRLMTASQEVSASQPRRDVSVTGHMTL